jgi:serine protease inhibitor
MRILPPIAICLLLSPLAFAKPGLIQDASAPRGALLMYDKLVGPNESDKALQLYYAASTRERALATALAKCDGAIANLRKQATDKFGVEVADAMLRAVNATTTDDINTAKITVAGDTATVIFPGSDHPIMMVYVKGGWKISVKSVLQDLKGSPKSFRQTLNKVATVANQTAAKIEQGQYATPEEASKQLLDAYKSAIGNPTK